MCSARVRTGFDASSLLRRHMLSGPIGQLGWLSCTMRKGPPSRQASPTEASALLSRVKKMVHTLVWIVTVEIPHPFASGAVQLLQLPESAIDFDLHSLRSFKLHLCVNLQCLTLFHGTK